MNLTARMAAAGRRARTWTWLAALLLVAASHPARADFLDKLHSELQAVNPDGSPDFTWPVPDGVKLTGVVLNHPEELLDSTPDAPGFMGGQWQVYVQATDAGDFGGTALWMGQYVGKIGGSHPEDSYTASEWLDEVQRLSDVYYPGQSEANGDTPVPLRQGALVEVYAQAGAPYRGKYNINEQHDTDPSRDFTIVMIDPNYGVPAPEAIALADVMDGLGQFIFVDTRASGAEHYQGSLVLLEDVVLEGDGSDWAPGATVWVTDGSARRFPLLLGLSSEFSPTIAPSGTFDVMGIFDQEATDNMDGYRLWLSDAGQFGPGPVAVPEPAGVVLATCGGLLLLLCRIKRCWSRNH